MKVDFRAYLEAKYALDGRSLNREVLQNLKQGLAAKRHLRCLDLGSGTGAMPKRLIDLCPNTSLELTGLDIDAGLLDIASEQLTWKLRSLGFQTEKIGPGITARRKQQSVRIGFECATVLDWSPHENTGGFDLISAHAFMDIVPLQPLVEKILDLLVPGGIFYSALNYDGDTALLPVYSDEEYERRILDHYDRSMEIRRIQEMPTGGARSGRRLLGELAAAGFAIHTYGTSDWNMTPVNGLYRDRDAFCLKSLLAMIRGEASGSRGFSPEALADWYSDRSRAVDAGVLGMIVHQLDILAVKDSAHRV
ncbi:MAG: class I SAM-dependent methyltransferase [Methylococcaceae bacterium]|nr:class I SAM-dependent methyltransferase [Methylococcaceae bacterium]